MNIDQAARARKTRTSGVVTRLVQIALGVSVSLFFFGVLGLDFSMALGSQDIQSAQLGHLLKRGGQNAKAPPNAPNSKQVDEGYLIGPSDVLSINVWKDTELTRTIPVRPDGKISFPLIGELPVSGMTAFAVQQVVTQKLKEYISDPQVTVMVVEVKSRTFSILGKVVKPGSYPLGKPTTVLEAIAIAGGFLDFAKQSKIYIIRPLSGGSTQTLPFDYKKVIKGQRPEENVELLNGDTVVVP